jgi:hypothetical protein
VHGFTDPHTIYDLANNKINITHVVRYMPLGIFQVKSSKEMSFPSLFYGNKHASDIVKNFTYLGWQVRGGSLLDPGENTIAFYAWGLGMVSNNVAKAYALYEGVCIAKE